MKKLLAMVFVVVILFSAGCSGKAVSSSDESNLSPSEHSTAGSSDVFETTQEEGTESTTVSTSNTGSKKAQSSTTKKTTTSSEYKVEVKDLTLPEKTLKNKTIRYLRNGPLSSDEQAILAIAKSKYGLNVEVINSGTGAEPMRKLIQMVHAGESPDIMDFDDIYYFVAKQNGLYQNIKNLIDWNDPKFRNNKGSSYYDYYVYAGSEPRWVLWYNAELFEKAGLKTPLYYLQRNEWTWAKLNELAKKLKNDNEGIKGFGAESGLFETRLASTGKDMIKRDSNGKYVSNLSDPVFPRIVNDWLNMTKEGYYYLGQDGANNFKKGKLAMYIGGKWLSKTYNLQSQVSSGIISFVPVPRDEQADDYYYMSIAAVGWTNGDDKRSGYNFLKKGWRNLGLSIGLAA